MLTPDQQLLILYPSSGRAASRRKSAELLFIDRKLLAGLVEKPLDTDWLIPLRGLATNLHRLGVPDKTIQAILRHSNVMTTMDIYVKNVSADSTAAMKLLETALCAQCAPAPLPGQAHVLN